MPLPSDGDGLSTNLSKLIHLGSHSPIAKVISPLSSLESQHLGGPYHISYSLEQLPFSITPFVAPSFVTSSFLIAPSSIVTYFTTPFRDPLVVPSSIAHVSPYVAFIVPSLVVPFNLPSNATPLLPTYAHPSSSGSNFHVDSPTSL
jgi:hypothetical protein